MLKVAIIGCGKIADAHAWQIHAIPGCEIVGVCDSEPLMARQLYDRFPVKSYFGGVAQMLAEAKPDVVHVTTPPHTHFEIAKLCLDYGAHTYVEKPFTVTAAEAARLVELANQRGVKLTVGHDDQFSSVACRLRKLVRDGYLGGLPVHMESYFCYDLGDATYARVLLGDKHHWVRRLPGRLLHNIISHGIARIAEFLTSDDPQILAHGFVSPLLRQIGETEIIDELRVIISEGQSTSAYFTFSSQMRPSLHEFRIFGPKNGLLLDQDHDVLIKLSGQKFKSYLEKFFPPALLARQYVSGMTTNVRSFLSRDLHMKQGMRNLMTAFYKSITEAAPVPIPYREIILTAKIMDCIFAQIHSEFPQPIATDRRSSELGEPVLLAD